MKKLSTFFENKFEMFLTSINESASIKDDPILKNDLFYTCQISIKNKQNITSRLSSDFIRIIFHDLFGSNLPVFDLEKLSDLDRENFIKMINKTMLEINEITNVRYFFYDKEYVAENV